MSVQFICRRCYNAYRAGHMYGQMCNKCVAAVSAAAKEEAAKTALADDLVRGVMAQRQSNNREDLK